MEEISVEEAIREMAEHIDRLTDVVNTMGGVLLGIIKALDSAGIRPPDDNSHTQH